MYRIDTLLKQKRKLFHTRDLALIWGIKNDNTLYTLIKRYIQKGVLIPIHKGYYSTLPLNEIDCWELAFGVIHDFAYKSCESVLVEKGVIFQQLFAETIVSSFSKRFCVADKDFLVRQMKDKYLFNMTGILKINDYFEATPERAAADLMYFNPKVYFDNPKSLNWKELKRIQKEVGFA